MAAHAVEITTTGDMIEAMMIGTITAGHTGKLSIILSLSCQKVEGHARSSPESVAT